MPGVINPSMHGHVMLLQQGAGLSGCSTLMALYGA